MHQILGLRPYFNEKKGVWDKTDNTFFKKNWRFKSIRELFENPDRYIEHIPVAERWNLYYTVAFCAEGKREFREQNVLVFDVDKIAFRENYDYADYIQCIAEALGVPANEMGIVASGNGLHFIIGLSSPIGEPTFFDRNRKHYGAVCDKLKAALSRGNLPGEPDPAVFDQRRIMRLPGTENRKDGKPNRKCFIINKTIVDRDYDLTLASGLPVVEAKDQINAQVLKKYPKPDTNAVLTGCDYLKWCKGNPNAISEAQWYGMLSIVPRLPGNGRDIAHEYSAGYGAYSYSETEAKIDQALASSGPRTCSNIDGLWGKCSACSNYGKVNSPIMIQGADYIATQDTGFHRVRIDDKGNLVPGKPQYEDLRRFFEKKHPYIILGESGICLIWNGKFWEKISDKELENFAQSHFNPPADARMRSEFKSLVCCTNLRKTKWFTESTNRKTNFNNGVLDLNTMVLNPHSIDYGFRGVLTYDYDPNAKAPRFEKFMLEIMQDRQDLIDVLLEFAGYSFSNDECWAQKALIMTGVGSNGKSTFMDILKDLAGKDNFSTLTLGDLRGETARKMLDGSLFNMAEETPTHAMAESSIFKNLVSGGETTVKVLYKQPYSIANRAKLMFACNELPQTKDTTRGFLRRLIIVPFEQKFEGKTKDSFIKEKLLGELPGIFNLVVKGYKRLREQKQFTDSETIDKEIEQYHTELDTVKAWFTNCVLPHLEPMDSETMTPISALYASYRIYAEAQGEKPETSTTLARRFSSLLPEHEARWARKMVKGKREVLYKGVKFSDGTQY